MGGAQPLAGTMAGAAILCVEVDPTRIERRLETRYLDEAADSLDDALERVRAAAAERRPLSVGLLGNAADVVPELVARGEEFDLITDQTAAHDPLNGYVPRGYSVEEAAALRSSDPDEYLRLARESIVSHVEALLEYVRRGAYVFDYGNNLRGEAREGGVEDAFAYPGFVPAYIRPLFCRGVGPFRWAVLSGDPGDIAAIDDRLRELFPDDPLLQRWLEPGARAGGVPGAARPDLLARLRRPREGGPRDQRARPQRRGQGSGGDRAGSPRCRLRRLAVSRDRVDARRLRRDRGLADPQRARQRGGGSDVGERPPRRRRGDRQRDPRGDGRGRRRHRRAGGTARARADDGPRHGRDAARGRRLSGGARRRRGRRAADPARPGDA